MDLEIILIPEYWLTRGQSLPLSPLTLLSLVKLHARPKPRPETPKVEEPFSPNSLEEWELIEINV